MNEMKRPPRKSSAYHEAGRMIVAYEHSIDIGSASIIPSKKSNTFLSFDGRHVEKRYNEILSSEEIEIMCDIAGRFAEIIAMGTPVGLLKDDDVDVPKMVAALHSDPVVRDAYLKYLMARAKQILVRDWDRVAAFARALTTHGTLNRDELVKVADDAGWGLPRQLKSDKTEELETALQAFLATSETDPTKAFVEGWNYGRFNRAIGQQSQDEH